MICASFGRRKRCGGGKRRRLNGCHAKGEREENGEGVRCLVRGQLEEKEGVWCTWHSSWGVCQPAPAQERRCQAATAHITRRAGRRGGPVGGGQHVGQQCKAFSFIFNGKTSMIVWMLIIPWICLSCRSTRFSSKLEEEKGLSSIETRMPPGLILQLMMSGASPWWWRKTTKFFMVDDKALSMSLVLMIPVKNQLHLI
jgi:hypothetical protein